MPLIRSFGAQVAIVKLSSNVPSGFFHVFQRPSEAEELAILGMD